MAATRAQDGRPGDSDHPPTWTSRTEIRGAGNATRQINHIIAPDFPADRLLVVEVLTPAGNWSSWPPHKHDVDDMPDEAVLEEIYHYRFRRPEAWAIQRIYRATGSPLGAPRDALWAVRDGEVVVVTDGYHPFAATDADDAYYLNALAGDRRTMACSFDPELDEVRSRWSEDRPTRGSRGGSPGLTSGTRDEAASQSPGPGNAGRPRGEAPAGQDARAARPGPGRRR